MPTPPPRPASPPPRSGLLGRFARCGRGATAIEFGIVAVPFLAMVFAILQTGIELWAGQVLETAVGNASRKLYTGQFQTDSSNAGLTNAQLLAKFKTLVCNGVSGLFDCTNMVSVDVQRFSSTSTPSVSKPVTNGAYDTSSYGYNPPGAGDIGVVRASMQYPIFVRLTPNGALRNGKRLIMASTTFRAEPYNN